MKQLSNKVQKGKAVINAPERRGQKDREFPTSDRKFEEQGGGEKPAPCSTKWGWLIKKVKHVGFERPPKSWIPKQKVPVTGEGKIGCTG